jgi:hypothetical protein
MPAPWGLMRQRLFVLSVGLALIAIGVARPIDAQLPLASIKSSGQTVTPVYEGWYRNPDGTFSLSFGYFNRNGDEVVQIPVGPDNFVEPGNQDQGQPTAFQPRRHWGVFAVKVPADFGLEEVTWTLKFRGSTFSIPGRLHSNWQIDALEGEAGSGNTPPILRFAERGPEGAGPFGVTGGTLSTTVGAPLSIVVWARDDGRASGSVSNPGKSAEPVALTWFKHQGPGNIAFNPASSAVDPAGGQAMTMASFSEAGEYIVRVRANDASGVANAGHAQCCWTNGFVRITVTR